MQITPSTFLKGLATYLPGVRKCFCSGSGGTVSARYCYSVWMRHLVKAHEVGLKTPLNKIAELGPGDSLGIGLCAVLCGVNEYYAFDTKAHANSARNKTILDELVMMFARRESIPDEVEFPNISPEISVYSFPHHILTEEILKNSLHPVRLEAIYKALDGDQTSAIVHIAYVAPWQGASLYASGGGGLDMVFSQAVMEHVEDVADTYVALFEWLRPGGFMSHTIDYKSHGYMRDWNGHWAVSDNLWKIVKGRRPNLINRLPHSSHIDGMKKAGFKILGETKKTSNPIPRQKISKSFLSLSDEDLRTSGAFIQAIKPLQY